MRFLRRHKDDGQSSLELLAESPGRGLHRPADTRCRRGLRRTGNCHSFRGRAAEVAARRDSLAWARVTLAHRGGPFLPL
jgi:hypothetical protein